MLFMKKNWVGWMRQFTKLTYAEWYISEKADMIMQQMGHKV